MDQTIPLEYGYYYHIFNKGIDGTDLFISNDNYTHFLRLYSEYIEPVTDTFAWALMRNHFHFLVRIKKEDEIGYWPETNEKTGKKFLKRKKYNPTNQFSHLFDAYAKAFNKRNIRKGGLFITPFRRVNVDNEAYFKHLVWYIHHNPVKHGFATSILEYPWTSYLSIISIKPTKLQRERVIGWFDSESNFKAFHNQNHDLENINPFIIE